MTYTTQQLQAMSDAQLNVALELKLNKGAEFVGSHYVESGDGIYPNVIKHKSWPNYRECTDYCNNPSDIMPLAFERGIKLSCVACPAGSGFVYYAKSYDGKLQSDYDSACRAIACLILLMEG